MRSKRVPIIFYFSKGKLAGLITFLILISFMILFFLMKEYEIEEVVIYTEGYKAEYSIKNEAMLQEFQHLFDEKSFKPDIVKVKPEFRIRVKRKIGSKDYIIVNKQILYKESTKEYIKLSPSLQKKVQKIIIKLQDLSPYGELVSWEKIDNYFPRYAKATIRDLETSLSFRVQRRAGSKHSDVQPITKEDTAIFKKIYDGHWSWRRRAVIVEVDDKKIAASMNGMPHGSGAIAGNDFSGHFCLHFLDSRVHTSNKVDPAHQAMVWKSAGRFVEYVAKQAPEDFPNLFFTLIDQKDEKLISLILQKEDKSINKLLNNFSRTKLDSAKIVINKRKLKSFQGNATIIDQKQNQREVKFDIKLTPNQKLEGWLIESVTLSEN